MPTTEYNVRMIRYRCPKYSPEEILGVLNEVQQVVYSAETDQTVKLDPLTGMPPYLVTTDNVFNYNCPIDCRRTSALFSQFSQSLNHYDSFRQDPGKFLYRGVEYRLADFTAKDGTQGVLSTVTFAVNPGATTTKYFHLYHITPPDLTNESIELTIPAKCHFMLRMAVIAMLSDEDYGDTGFTLKAMDEISARIRGELTGGNGGQRIGRTPVRPEYRDY
jgi:hypothetical protein